MRVTLCALIFALAVWPLAARADDSGPRKDVAAIRHDLAILLVGGPFAVKPPTQFESVVVSGADALVECYACSSITLIHLHYLYDRWWFLGHVAPSSEELLKAANLPQPLVALAHAHVAMTKKSDEPATQCKVFSCFFTSGETYDVRAPAQIAFDTKLPGFVSGVDGYRLTLAFAPSDGGSGAKLANVESRAPTPAESWTNRPGGNSYFFFSGTVQAPQPVHVQRGTTLDVWFPFVLDTSLTYSLTIGGEGFTPIGPIDGALADNTLHFVLPAFTAPPGVDMMGEIESD